MGATDRADHEAEADREQREREAQTTDVQQVAESAPPTHPTAMGVRGRVGLGRRLTAGGQL
ncbi:MAG TPA: hypothetical protein VGJ13_16720 [Pseudonocardiaceae bacterium]